MAHSIRRLAVVAALLALASVPATSAAANRPAAHASPADLIGPTQDYNGDGYDDLAIGAPGDAVVRGGKSYPGAGAVVVLYGSPSGLTAKGTSSPKTPHSQLWTQDSPNVHDKAEKNDHFGAALAAGDFNGDGYDDLAIGVPGEDNNVGVDSGVVQILYGSPHGLRADSREYPIAANAGISTDSLPGARFGSALVGMPFLMDSTLTGLAIGAPGMDSNDGAVTALYGMALDPDASSGGGSFYFPTVTGCSFGASLAAGYLDSDQYTDLVAGMPTCDRPKNGGGTAHQAGGVGVMLAASGLTYLYQGVDFGGSPESGDHLGASVAVADMTNDDVDDVLAGEPGKDVGGKSNVGVAELLPRSHDMLSWDTADTLEFHLFKEAAGDRYGAAMAASDELVPKTISAISAPGTSVHGHKGAGIVTADEGTRGDTFSQDTSGVLDTAETGDGFGSALEYGDFDGNGGIDLVIGVPGEDIGGKNSAGGVEVLYAKANSAVLKTSNDDFWTQASAGVGGNPQTGGRFGAAVP